jgi:CheY-like chemotaxis protein
MTEIEASSPAPDEVKATPEVTRIPNTILIVDDYLVDRRIAGAIVEKFDGLKATYASDGQEALDSIARELPALVLTDLQMPVMDGLALVEGIRERFPKLPVILMTAHGSEEVAIQALKAGATSYVPKKSLGTDLPKTLPQVLAMAAVNRHFQKLLSSLERRESTFKFENDPNLITPLIQMLQEDLGVMDLFDATARMRVGIALQEALTNAIYHGNLELQSDLRQDDERIYYGMAAQRRFIEPYRSRRLHVHACLEREQATYVINDEGPGFDTSALDRPIDPEDLMKIGGRGMLLIRTFMDQVEFNDAGNQITLTKRNRPRA